MIATGLAFELPIALLLLIKLGLVSPESLRKQRCIAYFIIFVFAELITPLADPIVVPLAVMIRMGILFELALFFHGPQANAGAASDWRQFGRQIGNRDRDVSAIPFRFNT